MARIAPEPSAAHPGVAPVIALSPSSIEDVQAWKTRPLDRVYQIVYFDAMFVRVREDRSVRARACYLAVGVTCDGEAGGARDLVAGDTEGAKFWLAALNDLRLRGVEDVLISCVNGLKGFPEAIEATFPEPRRVRWRRFLVGLRLLEMECFVFGRRPSVAG